MSEYFVQHWTNQNEGRNYPLADEVSRLSDSSALLPNDLLVDCYVALPASLGIYAFISSLTITANLVSIALAAEAADGTISALGVVTILKPLSSYQHYAITPLTNGVGGWIVFGSGTEEVTDLVLRFSNSTATRLSPKAVEVYTDYPVTGLGRVDTASLEDVVVLREGPGIEIIADTRRVDNVDRRCLVIRTSQDLDNEALARLAGPCGGRPENNTCGMTLIRAINGVEPDENGNIDIEVDGCEVSADDVVTADHAIEISPPITYVDACTPEYLPTEDGCLPDEDCQVGSESSSTESSEASSESSSSHAPPTNDFPYCSSFLDVAEDQVDASVAFDDAEGLTFFDVYTPADSWDLDECSLRYRTRGIAASDIAYAVSACPITSKGVVLRTLARVISNDDQRAGLFIVFGYQWNDTKPAYNYAGINFHTNEFGIYRKPVNHNAIPLLTSHGPKPTGAIIRSDTFKPYLLYQVADDQPCTYDIVVLAYDNPDVPTETIITLWVRWAGPYIPTGAPVGFDPLSTLSPNYSECWLSLSVPDSALTFVDGLYGVGCMASQSDTSIRFSEFDVQYIRNGVPPMPRFVAIGDRTWPNCQIAGGADFYFKAEQAQTGDVGTNDPFTDIWENIS